MTPCQIDLFRSRNQFKGNDLRGIPPTIMDLCRALVGEGCLLMVMAGLIYAYNESHLLIIYG